jgi:ATP diphosphatase
MRAVKLQNRAAQVGFDWPSAVTVTDKIAEESRELAEAAASGDIVHMAEEFGDLLFAMANLARHLKLDPEDALRTANAKFVRRFKAIETGLAARGRTLDEATLEEMEALWQDAKRAET